MNLVDKGVVEMFDKPITEMTLEEIDHAVEKYFDEVDKSGLLLDLLSAGFQLEEINFAYFGDLVSEEISNSKFRAKKVSKFISENFGGTDLEEAA